ncbi:hypothetical protein J1614_005488 [Plenodomus biglobosus]|nr:hypothetical protein J1614_005488 [Plenodomus biglobosus]
MASEPLPDHYKALGVERTADSASIKSIYRKLVLKFHPDKVTDPAQKEAATDRFHQIQQAYETLVDTEKRGEYEAHLTLEALRKEKAARGPAPRGDKNARFEGGASSYPPSRYTTEERKPSSRSAAYEEERYFEERARTKYDNKYDTKYDTYDAYPKTGSSSRSARPDKESPRSARPAAADRTRSDREKTRAKETRSERKFNAVDSESSADEKARYEADYKRRSEEDAARKQAAESRRKAEDRRSYEETRYAPSSARKLSVQEEEAIRYQHKSRGQVEAEMARPTYTRTSSRDAYGADHRSSRRPDVRPEAPRRSSARPKERAERIISASARTIPEIVDWSDDRRAPPIFKHSASSPANIEVPRSMPQRAYSTEVPREHRRSDKSPPATLHRSTTMPANHSAPRQKAPTGARPSGLRDTMASEHHSPEHDAFPSVPPPQPSSSSKKYYYTTSGGGGVTLRPEDIPGSAGKPRTVLREPARHHQRSPSPLSRPPIGPNRPSEASTATYTTKPVSAVRPPPMDRTTSSRNISPLRNSEERGRSSRKLYGEVNGSSADPRRARQASYSPSEVQYARKYGPEDVRWAPRGRENERDYPASKPTLGRTATYVY